MVNLKKHPEYFCCMSAIGTYDTILAASASIAYHNTYCRAQHSLTQRPSKQRNTERMLVVCMQGSRRVVMVSVPTMLVQTCKPDDGTSLL